MTTSKTSNTQRKKRARGKFVYDWDSIDWPRQPRLADVARLLGCSVQAVRQHCINHGLLHPRPQPRASRSVYLARAKALGTRRLRTMTSGELAKAVGCKVNHILLLSRQHDLPIRRGYAKPPQAPYERWNWDLPTHCLAMVWLGAPRGPAAPRAPGGPEASGGPTSTHVRVSQWRKRIGHKARWRYPTCKDDPQYRAALRTEQRKAATHRLRHDAIANPRRV